MDPCYCSVFGPVSGSVQRRAIFPDRHLCPDWARVVTPYPPAPAFDPKTVQSTIGQPSDLTPISATIFQLSLRDVPQQDLWSAVARAQSISAAKLHKLSIIKGDEPRRYHLDLIFHRGSEL